ncbi:hypothetical protein bas08_0052 [Escherichia phage DanielBernoulli]|uniref:Uncharacterized protein n=1 Tax=Escherichia phage DanielBernoulli TaxID=2851972 RepID=A0AAE7VQH1_9CAUD|nr:hypothetical protein bas08_0052 [Escherichia phage DanielBernoulli]
MSRFQVATNTVATPPNKTPYKAIHKGFKYVSFFSF